MTTASYTRVNYQLRSAKHAERMMLLELFRRTPFAPTSSYGYLGMGAIYFADFKLFHKALGLRKMISLEAQQNDQARFEFNRPHALEIRYGQTSSILPTLKLDGQWFVWLDYDKSLDKKKVADLESTARKLGPGSYLVASFPAHFRPKTDKEIALLLTSEFGASVVGGKKTVSQSEAWEALSRHCFARIAKVLADEDASLPAEKRRKFWPLLKWAYSDGTWMLSAGGLVYTDETKATVEAARYGDLEICDVAKPVYRIEVPRLTFREIQMLERQLPLSDPSKIEFVPVPEKDARAFAALYRYLPMFVPVDI